MLRIAVVEDDPTTRQQLLEQLERYRKERQIELNVEAFSDGADLAEEYCPGRDAILLDIEMPHMDGISAAQQIRRQDQDVIIIFITNLAKYAIRGYEVNALDFVLKPVSYYALSMRLDRIVSSLAQRNRQYLLINIEDGVIRLSTDDITYIEVLRHRLYIHTKEECYTSAGTLTEMEERLRSAGFARCNKGYLVNLRHVSRIYPDSVEIGPDRLLISRRKRDEFLSAVTDYYGRGGR